MATLNPQAVELNNAIAAANPHVVGMLSERGKGIYFPAKGILAQSAEAKGKKINATIGIALEDDGSPLCLPCLTDLVKLSKADAFNYAPSFGKPELRAVWRQMIYRKNPGLGQTPISAPLVTNALTHGLSMCGYLFADPGERVILTDLFWGNYRLIFTNAYGAELVTFNTFTGEAFDVAALRAALNQGPVGKRIVLLNFPNNPAGYTPTDAEALAIRDALVAAAAAGNSVVVLIDDAYFGLVFRAGVFKESLFSLLANAHERLLAVKLDGATKEDYVWGFRVGFITFGIKGGTEALYKALENKAAGAIRGNISNAPHLSQSLLVKAFTHPEYEQQKAEKFATLRRRYERVGAVLGAHPEFAEAFTPVPFNSGYFMCVRLKNADPEAVRQLLLSEYSTGVIAASGVIRVAFSATPTDRIEELFTNIYQATLKVRKQA